MEPTLGGSPVGKDKRRWGGREGSGSNIPNGRREKLGYKGKKAVYEVGVSSRGNQGGSVMGVYGKDRDLLSPTNIVEVSSDEQLVGGFAIGN